MLALACLPVRRLPRKRSRKKKDGEADEELVPEAALRVGKGEPESLEVVTRSKEVGGQG